MRKKFLFVLMVLWASSTVASDYLVKFRTEEKKFEVFSSLINDGMEVEELNFNNWVKVSFNESIHSSKSRMNLLQMLQSNPAVISIQPNYKIKLIENFKVEDPNLRLKLENHFSQLSKAGKVDADKENLITDNPAIPAPTREGAGTDPQFDKQWGMRDIGVKEAWNETTGSRNMIVAVLDTGVDYTHEDLVNNIWRNPGETGVDALGRNKATNGVDDDNNGYIDDTAGWDFVSNDNKPYDLYASLQDVLLKGGNPGHGTHCAGNVAARYNNNKGIAGVAPNVKIMALRFLSEKGQGTTADAIKAIRYAVDNGAKVLSNSWGSEGEDASEPTENEALREVIRFSQKAGTLFIAAAGNGHSGKGYDNDTDSKPGYPASYDMENIISVAALNEQNQLGSFSNWGKRTVDLGAPGVKVFSTIPNQKYSDTVVDLFGMKVTWDGTSMATPHVAGAAALYWSHYPDKSWREVKQALMSSATKIDSLSGKTVSGGKLNVQDLLKY